MNRPISILHVVGCLNRGGVETWLAQVMEHIDRTDFCTDFLVDTEKGGAYDERIRTLGCRVIVCPNPHRVLEYRERFHALLRELGPYDTVHSRLQLYNGLIMRFAKECGVRVRIAHSHNDTRQIESRAGMARQFYAFVASRLIQKYASAGLGCSEDAMVALLGERWRADPRWSVLHYGIDLRPFQTPSDRRLLRASLEIGEKDYVIGHVGRFKPQNNHVFLVQIAKELVRLQPRVRFLLVGDGYLRAQIEQALAREQLAKSFIPLGVRPDVPQLMQSVMDAFLFPSIYEGLGLVLLEAQAAGLPCVISDTVPREAVVVRGLITMVGLKETAAHWAGVLDSTMKNTNGLGTAAVDLMSSSHFTIAKSSATLSELYLTLA